MTPAKTDELGQGLRHQPPLPLGTAAAQAPSWQTAVGAEPAEWFSFPYDDAISCGGHNTVWRALSHHRLGNGDEARRALEAAATCDETSAYALTASAPELQRLSRHYSEQEMPDVARLYQEVAEIVGGPARVGHGVGRTSP